MPLIIDLNNFLFLQTSEITSGKYTLVVESDNFSEKRTLTYIKKKYSFFVQFNKAIFLPGDLLQFRVFAVDSETKAATPTCSNIISITDPNRNSIMSFPNVTFKRGKYENSFQLSEKASLGVWYLRVQCDQEVRVLLFLIFKKVFKYVLFFQNVQKVFEVAEYTRPLLSATLSVQQITPFKFGKVTITVDVAYTSGGDASGSATVKINRNGQNILERTVTISFGSGTFDLDIVKDLKVEAEEEAYFDASVVFDDPLTGNKVSDAKSFSIVQYSYGFRSKPDAPMKPGEPFKFTITMQRYDGSPAPAGTQLQLVPDETKYIPTQTLTIGRDGTVSSSIDIPANEKFLSMFIKSDDAYDGYLSSRIAYSEESSIEDGSYLRFDVLTQE